MVVREREGGTEEKGRGMKKILLGMICVHANNLNLAPWHMNSTRRGRSLTRGDGSRLTRRIGAALAVVLLPLGAWGWTGLGQVTGVYSHAGYNVIVTTINDNPCGSSGKYYWPTSSGDAKDMFAISLTALSTGASVSVVTDANTSTCLWGGQRISYLFITN